MKYVARKQVKDLFTRMKIAKVNGLWFSGYEGEGEFKIWHSNYKLRSHSFYKNSKKDGEYKGWDEKGRLIMHYLYKDGEVIKDYLK